MVVRLLYEHIRVNTHRLLNNRYNARISKISNSSMFAFRLIVRRQRTNEMTP